MDRFLVGTQVACDLAEVFYLHKVKRENKRRKDYFLEVEHFFGKLVA